MRQDNPAFDLGAFSLWSTDAAILTLTLTLTLTLALA